MKLSHILIIFLLAVLFLQVPQLLAQEAGEEISVTASSMRSLSDGTLIAEGQVVVMGEGVTVRADSLRYDAGSDTLLLTGNVVMEEDGGGAFTGDALVLDLSDLTGGISSGEIIIVPNGFRVRGEDIQRTGAEEYSVSKGVFTSCPGDCPDWSFTASEIKVRKEGYLQAKHAAFRILDVPVFYTPYLLYPVKTKRQTGLLFPELSFSEESGMESRWPIFVTMGSNADATVSPRTFSRDGFGLDLETRYLLDWGGGGQVKGFAMTGERPERWYVGAEHAMAFTPDLWLRWRWYDAGEAGTPVLFGDSFKARYPGAVFRHATLEGRQGILGYSLQTSSLIVDGTRARSDLPGGELPRDAAMLSLGPHGGDLWRAGLEAEDAYFENDGNRTLVRPSLALQLPGPWKLAGSVQGEGIIGVGGEGSVEDEAWIVSVAEKLTIASSGGWGRHLADLEITVLAAQGGAFGGSILRDSKDLVEERKVLDLRFTSALDSSDFSWDLTAGTWSDSELDLSLGYGWTRFSHSGAYLEASRNRDADFGLVLPSLAFDEELLKGWQVKAGYESQKLAFSLARDSAAGFAEMINGTARFSLAGVRVLTGTIYDMDEDAVADETVRVEIPGRCWTVGIERSRSPSRTNWSMQLELGL